ncbi:hypothetical protein JCM33374_g478 [Metschnikowia sp. JCM 33374]|nr:hypothetical protein JCM33374_g478 [Metschnikowia sp. JCM 33374]
MTKSPRVLKFFKMNILKKHSGAGPKSPSTDLVTADTTSSTESSGVNTKSKLYKMTTNILLKETNSSKRSSTEFSSSQSPSGAFATEAATKTTTTTTNGTESEHPTISVFTKFSGLFKLEHRVKDKNQVFLKTPVPHRLLQKDGNYSAQIISTSTVDQSVDTEEAGASNNASDNNDELAPGTLLEKEKFFQPEFSLVTQTQEVTAGGTRRRQFPERGTSQDTALKGATANDATTSTPNKIKGGSSKQYWKRLRNTKRRMQKVYRKLFGRESSSSEVVPYDHSEGEGHRRRYRFWWTRSMVSDTHSFGSTTESVQATKKASVFRKLHMGSVTRKVDGWSRKMRMAAKSPSSDDDFLPVLGNSHDSEAEDEYTPDISDISAASFDLESETASMPELVVPFGEETAQPVLSADTEAFKNTEDLENTKGPVDDTDETDDTASIETFNGSCEIQVVGGSGDKEVGLQKTEDTPSGWEFACVSAKIPPTTLPLSQRVHLSSKNEGNVNSKNKESHKMGGISEDLEATPDYSRAIPESPMESTQVSATFQILPEGSLEQETARSAYAIQELISKFSERFEKSCDNTSTITETIFLNERGLLRSHSDTERQQQISQPVFNSRYLNEIRDLDIEGESMPSEVPHIIKEGHFSTRKFKLTPSVLREGFIKELQLVGRCSGHVDAERKTVVHKMDKGAQAGKHKLEADKEQPVEGISEVEKPLKLPECGSFVRKFNGFTLDVIERKAHTEKKASLDIAVSSLLLKDNEEAEGDDDSVSDVGGSQVEEKGTLWATLGSNHECGSNFARAQKFSFSPHLEVFSTRNVPSKCILKKPMVTNTNAVEVLKPLEQSWTVEYRQTLAEEMLQRFLNCRETMVKFAGKHGLSELKEPLETFSSCFKFILNNYVGIKEAILGL